MPAEEIDPNVQPTKPIHSGPPPQLRLVGLAGVAILLIAIVAFAGKVNADNVRRNALTQMSNALSAALVEPAMTHDKARLALLVQRIATDGGLEAVTITDPEGAVVASTDSKRLGQVIERLKKPPAKAELRDDNGRTSAVHGLFVGADSAVGGLEIVAGS